jgi:hypothetical protein
MLVGRRDGVGVDVQRCGGVPMAEPVANRGDRQPAVSQHGRHEVAEIVQPHARKSQPIPQPAEPVRAYVGPPWLTLDVGEQVGIVGQADTEPEGTGQRRREVRPPTVE